MVANLHTLTLKVLFIEEADGGWSAQCLDYDIAAQARRLSDLRYEFERVVMAQLTLSEAAGEQAFQGIGPAPQEYWEMYEAAVAELRVERAEKSSPFSGMQLFPLPEPHFKVIAAPAG